MVEVKCKDCGRPFYIRQSTYDSKSNKQFLCNKCFVIAQGKIISNYNRKHDKQKPYNGKKEKDFNEDIITNSQRQFWKNLKLHQLDQIEERRTERSKIYHYFESYFFESILSRIYYFKQNEFMKHGEYAYTWAYGIYHQSSDQLIAVVDIDEDDSNENDIRLQSLNGMKYTILYSDKWKLSFEQLIQTVMDHGYDEFVDKMFAWCRSLPDIPYPQYEDDQLFASWNALCAYQPSTDMVASMNNRSGDKIINQFHRSIYSSRAEGFKMSPYEAWWNDEIVLEVIKNRMIYINNIYPNKILQGFNIAKIAKKVSVFSAGRAKILCKKYLNHYDIIYDPFSGFSGRMLGVCSLGKRYIGNDISELHTRESNQIIEYLHLEQLASVTVADIHNTHGEYECLFTCSPYRLKETWLNVPEVDHTCDEWIDICLKNFKCKSYLFVVDETERYKDCIVEEIFNKGHIGKNTEYVILIER